MLLGPPGSGKTTVWKTLIGCYNHNMPKPVAVFETVNPKAVTTDELYGYMNFSKDWKDGVLSIIMRNMSKSWAPFHQKQTSKWVVLDGDIDAVWIESMNTVMDDNKMLTLVSNERIPLSESMRMIFEIHSLKNATPATVSRAGILYINETDVGYQPFVESWIRSRTDGMERDGLQTLFDKHTPVILDLIAGLKMETLAPTMTINMVQTICYLLEGLLPLIPEGNKAPDLIERLFLFSAVWAFGATAISDKNNDSRRKFSSNFSAAFKAIKFPEKGSVFDYMISPVTGELQPWADLVPKHQMAGETQYANIVVPTVDSYRLTYLMELLVKRGKAVLLVGSSGTGKTVMVREFLRNVNGDNLVHANVNMNYYTDAAALQQQLESPIDKRSGKTFGPPPSKKLIYFIDDLNMPFVEQYGTQTPLALLRQHFDYKSWYDRNDLSLKKAIVDVQYIAAMNPKGGSFIINPRLQRHFVNLGCQTPSDHDLSMIYGSIFRNHIVNFPSSIQKCSSAIIEASILLLKEVSAKFLPSAVKFHYNFNMRDMANIFQGLVHSSPEYHNTPTKLLRLWLHESMRVFCDRLISQTEILRCKDIFLDIAKRTLSEENTDVLFAQPLIFTNFIETSLDDTPIYTCAVSMAELKRALEKKLLEYNESNAIMDLVLFENAIEHVCRIARIISFPRGNALLVGVGGSGKQSLSKLAASICGYSVVQISVASDYGISDLKEEMKRLYKKAGVKPADPLVFMLTDSQIVDERFLVFFNDLLSSGVIPDLFAPDELDAIVSQLRSAAKSAGIPDTRDSILDFFIGRVRSNLHVILCFSPVGNMFRTRARRFPALINCTSIDWFHEWPKEALINVAQRFLADVDMASVDVKENVSHHIAEVHTSLTVMSETYFQQERRYNYTTPRSFLELIHFFKSMLKNKRHVMSVNIQRLSSGVVTLNKTNRDVEALKEDLKIKMREVDGKKEATDQLLAKMGVKRAEAEAQQAIADKEREKADIAAAEARAIEEQAAGDLEVARPALDRAQEAVDCLDKASMTELKSFTKPPAGIDKVTSALLIMIKNEKKNFSWENAKKMMAKVDAFKEQLENYRGEDIPEDVVQRVQPYLDDEEFTYEKMKSKSSAAANLCNWVINIVGFNAIYKKVRPLMDALEKARAAKAQAEADLAEILLVLAEVESNLKKLQAAFMDATEEKTKVEQEAKLVQDKLSLAERLTVGLASENSRWSREIELLKAQDDTLVGDVLLAAAFVSYAGAFSADYRDQLWRTVWKRDLSNREIHVTENIDPLQVLTSDSVIADWMNNGLPADRTSIENGAMLTNSQRWPLIIDPQLQGIKWLKAQQEARVAANNVEGRKLIVLQLGQKKWMNAIILAIQQGHTVIIENIGENIDAVLDPVLSRAVFWKGKSLYLRMGGEDIEYDSNFQLYLQTNLSNPHYRPEIFAQCTLINFIVTKKGLEDQLLAKVVAEEQPDLERQKNDLVKAFNSYMIQLKDLEDQLLERLANAPEDILSDIPLIEGLEATKKTAMAISEAVRLGKETEKGINEAREVYRPVASEASLLYFLLLKLYRIDHMYQYSLDSFSTFFKKSMQRADSHPDHTIRTKNLCLSLRKTIYTWVSRGLFEKHKLIFLSLLTSTLLQQGKIENNVGFTAEGWKFLLRGPRRGDEKSPVDWLPNASWGMLNALAEIDGFHKLASDVYDSAPRFKEWFNQTNPETEKLPLDWRELDKRPFLKLLVVRCMRPDRLTVAVTGFIRNLLPHGDQYTDIDAQLNSFQVLDQSFLDSSPRNPLYFILSPGANIVADVDKLAKKYGMIKGQTYHNISLGQGQDTIAMEKLETAHMQGHWVVLNNVHLMPRWLKTLQKRLDEFNQANPHENFRVLLSSDPSPTIPIGILERSIKLTNDPPSGLKANLKQAFCCFSREEFEDFEPRTRGILFGLCHFHAIMLERKKFGAKGYNMSYPFSIGDLTCSASVLRNYMENAPVKVPWADLRYLFGEIMYGGHIVNDFDRLVCATYLDFFMKDDLMDGMSMFPYPDESQGDNFTAPPTSYSFEKVLEHLDEGISSDTPVAFGLHPNAEIGFRTETSEKLFKTILELSPQERSGGEDAVSPQQAAEAALQDILDMFRDARFELDSIKGSVEEMGPFQNVFLQECESMNALLSEMIRSLLELDMGFKGDLTMSEAMETLQDCLFMEKIPPSWEALAYPSLRSLSSWLVNLQLRRDQLSTWVANTAEIPMVTWISGLFNPQSFLTAVMQVTAQSQNKELDKLSITTEITKKSEAVDVTAHSKDGAYIWGLSLEGARWNAQGGFLEKSNPREMYCPMPIINCKAMVSSRPDSSTFPCPVYKTQQRGPTYVFTAGLKTKALPAKWVLAGTVLIMDIV